MKGNWLVEIHRRTTLDNATFFCQLVSFSTIGRTKREHGACHDSGRRNVKRDPPFVLRIKDTIIWLIRDLKER